MRATYLLVGGLALLVGACSGRTGGHAPPPLDKDLLTGKWENASPAPFLAGCEFADDGTAKVTFRGMKRPVPVRYAWSGERAIDLKYPTSADIRRAYKAAAKAYKERLEEKVKTKELTDRALGPMLGMVRDELPERETFRVALSAKPRLLTLTTPETGAKQNFEKAD
jgi:hypothetical protein